MLLEKTPDKFRTSFLLILTKEMIENTRAYSQALIKKEIEKFLKMKEEEREKEERESEKGRQKEEIKKAISERTKEDKERLSEMYIKGLPLELKALSAPTHTEIRKFPLNRIPPILKIPELALPETMSYLRPIATPQEIDLGKLNILVNDPLVKVIECNGPDENILVMGIMGRKPTQIKLSEEELKGILEKFSVNSKIPINEGLFKAAVGKIIISAVVSEIAGIKFVIRKIPQGF